MKGLILDVAASIISNFNKEINNKENKKEILEVGVVLSVDFCNKNSVSNTFVGVTKKLTHENSNITIVSEEYHVNIDKALVSFSKYDSQKDMYWFSKECLETMDYPYNFKDGIIDTLK